MLRFLVSVAIVVGANGDASYLYRNSNKINNLGVDDRVVVDDFRPRPFRALQELSVPYDDTNLNVPLLSQQLVQPHFPDDLNPFVPPYSEIPISDVAFEPEQETLQPQSTAAPAAPVFAKFQKKNIFSRINSRRRLKTPTELLKSKLDFDSQKLTTARPDIFRSHEISVSSTPESTIPISSTPASSLSEPQFHYLQSQQNTDETISPEAQQLPLQANISNATDERYSIPGHIQSHYFQPQLNTAISSTAPSVDPEIQYVYLPRGQNIDTYSSSESRQFELPKDEITTATEMLSLAEEEVELASNLTSQSISTLPSSTESVQNGLNRSEFASAENPNAESEKQSIYLSRQQNFEDSFQQNFQASLQQNFEDLSQQNFQASLQQNLEDLSQQQFQASLKQHFENSPQKHFQSPILPQIQVADSPSQYQSNFAYLNTFKTKEPSLQQLSHPNEKIENVPSDGSKSTRGQIKSDYIQFEPPSNIEQEEKSLYWQPQQSSADENAPGFQYFSPPKQNEEVLSTLDTEQGFPKPEVQQLLQPKENIQTTTEKVLVPIQEPRSYYLPPLTSSPYPLPIEDNLPNGSNLTARFEIPANVATQSQSQNYQSESKPLLAVGLQASTSIVSAPNVDKFNSDTVDKFHSIFSQFSSGAEQISDQTSPFIFSANQDTDNNANLSASLCVPNAEVLFTHTLSEHNGFKYKIFGIRTI